MANNDFDPVAEGATAFDPAAEGATPIEAGKSSPKNEQDDDNSPIKDLKNLNLLKAISDTLNPVTPEAKAFQAGGVQGATLGLSTDIGAAKDVAGDVLSGNQGTDGLYNKWRQYQQSRQAANKALQSESPWAYGTGELAGGVATIPFMPEMGGAKALSMIGEAAPGAGAFLAGLTPDAFAIKNAISAGEITAEAGAAALKALPNAGKLSIAGRLAGAGASGAIEGAPVGAAYGAGMSDSDIDHPTQLAKDMMHGAEMGSITGAALTATAKGGSMALDAAGNAINDSRFIRQLKEAYNYGKQGVDLGSSSAQDTLSVLPNQQASDLVTKIFGIDEQLGKNVGKAINDAQSNGVKIDIDPQLAENGKQIWDTLFVDSPVLGKMLDPKSQKVLQTISQQDLGAMNPVEAKSLRDNLYNMVDSLAGVNTPEAAFAKQQGITLAKSIDATLKSQIDDYKVASAQFETFRRLVPESIMTKGMPSEYNSTYVGNLANPEQKLYQSSRDMLMNSQLPGAAVEGQRSNFQQLANNIRQLEQTNPGAVQAMGGNAEEVIAKLRKQSDQLAMIRQAQGFDPHSGGGAYATGQVFGFAPNGPGQGMSVANKLGRSMKAAGESAPVQQATKLFQAGDSALYNLAQVLKQSQPSEFLGSALEKSLMNKNESAKNAVLFKLLQDPNYRNLLSDQGLDADQ